MVYPLKRYFRIVRLETASIFTVDGCTYIHWESEVYASKHKSLSDWIALNPRLERRLEFLSKCFEVTSDFCCVWCGEDQALCYCEVDANGLVWNQQGVGIPFQDGEFPF